MPKKRKSFSIAGMVRLENTAAEVTIDQQTEILTNLLRLSEIMS